MARLGTEKHPTVVRVQNVERAQEIAALCMAHGIHYVIGLEPNEPEDVTDLGSALSPAEPSKASWTVQDARTPILGVKTTVVMREDDSCHQELSACDDRWSTVRHRKAPEVLCR